MGQIDSLITGENPSIKISPMIFANPVVLILTMFVLYPILRYIIRVSRNISYKIDAFNDIQTLNREINVKYNPSIVSYLIDGEINQRALAADIMNLYAKKIINIDNQVIENKKRYKLTTNAKMIKSVKIYKSDAYIIESIIYKKHKFEFSEWDKLVEHTLFNRGFHKTGQKKYSEKDLPKPLCIIFLVLVYPMFICFKEISYAIIFSLFLTCLSVIPIIYLFDFLNSKETQKLNLNKLGKEEVKNWIKFENFIKNYTLIKDKNIEDIVLYEKYIPYAVALGINMNYKDTMYSAFNELEIKEILNDIKNKDVFGDYENNDNIFY